MPNSNGAGMRIVGGRDWHRCGFRNAARAEVAAKTEQTPTERGAALLHLWESLEEGRETYERGIVRLLRDLAAAAGNRS